MITSERTFGVEIEFSCPSKQQLYRIGEQLNLTDDGSIRHIPFSAEYVSEVLRGSKGEKKIHHVCEILKKNGASGDNSAMSVHVHLDGGKRNLGICSSNRLPDEKHRLQTFAFSNRLVKEIGVSNIEEFVRSGGDWNVRLPQHSSIIIDGIVYYSLAPISKRPKFNYTYFWLDTESRTKWLRNVFYFYTMFSQVMEDIVSNSRRFGNMFCIPLGESYNLEEIEACQTMSDLRHMWYKGRPPNGHYDDSRYHNVNLHSYWDRHGTVEIRSHGGTVDPNKILLWVKLHQQITDKLETLDIEYLKSMTEGKTLHQAFIDFIEDPLLQSYVKRLMGYYSNINLK